MFNLFQVTFGDVSELNVGEDFKEEISGSSNRMDKDYKTRSDHPDARYDQRDQRYESHEKRDTRREKSDHRQDKKEHRYDSDHRSDRRSRDERKHRQVAVANIDFLLIKEI